MLHAELGFQANPCPAGGTGQIVYLSSRIRGGCTDARSIQSIIFELGQTGTLIVDWGVHVLGPGDAAPIGGISNSNDLRIDGACLESSYQGAVRTDAYDTRIVNSRFESNGRGSLTMPNRGILVAGDAQETRILTNVFSNDCIRIENAATERSFNIPDNRNTAQCR
jgi:hypothetical protein